MTERVTDQDASTAPALALRLVVLGGEGHPTDLALAEGEHVIGAGSGSALVLTDPLVSRAHLKVEVHGARVTAVDLGSTNGSFLNGMRFTSIDVLPGAVIRLGRTELQFLPSGAARNTYSERETFGGLIGRSLVMRALFARLERISATAADVLIEGETGTGKELCAEAIHAHSPRAKGPFVICDLAGVPAALLESELFGHVRGAFTGADRDRAGAFERASSGTVFLDEIGEMPLDVQPRLLRALERRHAKRLGSNDYRPFDARIVAATHRDLDAEVKAGRFRLDLLQRLGAVRLRLPALREHAEDIPAITDALLHRMGREPSDLEPGTRALLTTYVWPGNVRELHHVVERVVSLGEEPWPERGATATARVATPAHEPEGFKEAKEKIVTAFERDYVSDMLRRAKGNIAEAARRAGIERAYLHRLIKKLGIDPDAA